MFKRNRKKSKSRQGSLLVGAFMLSVALAVSLAALLSYSRAATHQAESVLSRSQLGRMTQEKFTRDVLAVYKNIDPLKFDAGPTSFPGGEAQSSIQWIPSSLKKFESCLYLVVVATITNESAPAPRHISLETIVEFGPPASARVPLSPHEKIYISESIVEQMRVYLSENDPRFEDIKQQILSAAEAQLGSGLDSASINVGTVQYRNAWEGEMASTGDVEKEGPFYLSPISVDSPIFGPRIRVWKEKYY